MASPAGSTEFHGGTKKELSELSVCSGTVCVFLLRVQDPSSAVQDEDNVGLSQDSTNIGACDKFGLFSKVHMGVS